ncbi:MAG: hypothetical protein ACXVPU_06185 [Bacteroidia bacterium]
MKQKIIILIFLLLFINAHYFAQFTYNTNINFQNSEKAIFLPSSFSAEKTKHKRPYYITWDLGEGINLIKITNKTLIPSNSNLGGTYIGNLLQIKIYAPAVFFNSKLSIGIYSGYQGARNFFAKPTSNHYWSTNQVPFGIAIRSGQVSDKINGADGRGIMAGFGLALINDYDFTRETKIPEFMNSKLPVCIFFQYHFEFFYVRMETVQSLIYYNKNETITQKNWELFLTFGFNFHQSRK